LGLKAETNYTPTNIILNKMYKIIIIKKKKNKIMWKNIVYKYENKK
jgi:hypothetical protein